MINVIQIIRLKIDLNENEFGVDTYLDPKENTNFKKLVKIPFEEYRPTKSVNEKISETIIGMTYKNSNPNSHGLRNNNPQPASSFPSRVCGSFANNPLRCAVMVAIVLLMRASAGGWRHPPANAQSNYFALYNTSRSFSSLFSSSSMFSPSLLRIKSWNALIRSSALSMLGIQAS